VLKRQIIVAAGVGLALVGAVGAFTLKGSILDGEAGKPAAGMTIRVEHHGNRQAEQPDDFFRTTKTDEKGAFSIELSPQKRDYMFLVMDAAGRIFDGHTHVKADMDAGVVTLQKTGEVCGALKDGKGSPLKGIEVTVERRLKPYRCTHYVTVTNVLTDEEGAFTVSGLNHGQYQCTTESPNHAPEKSKVDVTDDFAYLELRLKAGCSIEGRVAGAEGPVAGVTVAVGRAKATTDAEGRFKLTGLSEGRQHLTVRGEGYANAPGERTYVTCKVGKPADCTLKVVRTGTLFLRLQAAEGDVVIPEKVSVETTVRRKGDAGAGSISSSMSRSYPVTNGTVVVSSIAAGEYGVKVTGDGITAPETEVTVPEAGEEHEIVLVNRSYALKGKIVGPDGKPVPNTQVSAQPKRDKKDGRFRRYMHDRSEADGAFELKNMAVGEYELDFRHDDWMRTQRDVAIPGAARETLVVKLERGLTISGSVSEADGSGATNFQVQVNGPKGARGDRRIYKTIKVAGDGAFAVGGLGEGKYDLTFREEGARESESSMSDVEAGTDELMVILGARIKLSGIVRTPGGKPVEGASIVCTKTESGRVSYYGRRDDDGVKSGGDGTFAVSVREGNKYQLQGSLSPHLPAATMVDLSAGADPVAQPVVLQLTKGHIVKGQVIDATTGKPVAGVIVRLNSGRQGVLPFSRGSDGDDEKGEKTDAEGGFALDGAPAGVVQVSVYRSEESEHPVATRKLRVAEGKANSIKIELEKLGSVKGKILRGDGSPVAETQVMMYSPRNPMGQYNAQTDSEGAFAIEDVPPGDYMVMCFAMRGEDGVQQRQASVSVKAGETAEVTIGGKPEKRGQAVKGTVTKAGKPVGPGTIRMVKMPESDDLSSLQNVFMTVGGMGGDGKELDEAGRFAVDEGLAPGKHLYWIQLKKDGEEESAGLALFGMLSGTVDVKDGAADLIIKIPAGVLSGKVKLIDGSPAAEAQVMLLRDGASAMEAQMMRKFGTTDEDGAYRIEGLVPGKYKVNVYHENGAMRQGSVELDDGAQTKDIEIDEGVEVCGTVKFADGKPAAQGMIMAAGEDDEIVGFAMADATGAFSLQPKLATGQYTLFAYLQDYAVEARRVTIEKAASLSFELVPSGDVEVTVTDAQGKGVEGQAVELKDDTGGEVIRLSDSDQAGMLPWQGFFGGKTDKRGMVKVTGLRPGAYTAKVKGSAKKAEFTVVELETAKVTVGM
jgi:5-hydroxyisourate hydrolase-like protein (transthyretin family)